MREVWLFHSCSLPAPVSLKQAYLFWEKKPFHAFNLSMTVQLVCDLGPYGRRSQTSTRRSNQGWSGDSRFLYYKWCNHKVLFNNCNTVHMQWSESVSYTPVTSLVINVVDFVVICLRVGLLYIRRLCYSLVFAVLWFWTLWLEHVGCKVTDQHTVPKCCVGGIRVTSVVLCVRSQGSVAWASWNP